MKRVHKLKYDFGCKIEMDNASYYFIHRLAMETIQIPVLIKYKRKMYKKANMNFGFGPVFSIIRTYGQFAGTGHGLYQDSSLKIVRESNEIRDFNIIKGFDEIVEQNTKYNVNDSQDWYELSTYVKGNYFYWGIGYQYYINL